MIYPLRKAGFGPFDEKFDVSEYIIMASFFPDVNEKTIKELGGRSGYSYERVYTTLKSLEEKGIVTGRMIGKTLSYELDLRKDAVELAFVHFSIVKKAKFAEKYPNASKAMKEFLSKVDADCVIVFGSYAKGEAKRESDMDILCVSGNENIEKIALSMRHKYNLRINPVLVNVADFKNIKSENPEFWNDLIEFGIILKGYEFFYNYAFTKTKG